MKTAQTKKGENPVSEIKNITVGEIQETLARADELRNALGGLGGPAPAQNNAPIGRAVLVIDRGWIFAGDQSATPDGHVRLDNAVHVFRWESISFAKMLVEWRGDNVDLRPCEPVEVPRGSIIFRVPVPKGWGLK